MDLYVILGKVSCLWFELKLWSGLSSLQSSLCIWESNWNLVVIVCDLCVFVWNFTWLGSCLRSWLALCVTSDFKFDSELLCLYMEFVSVYLGFESGLACLYVEHGTYLSWHFRVVCNHLGFDSGHANLLYGNCFGMSVYLVLELSGVYFFFEIWNLLWDLFLTSITMACFKLLCYIFTCSML